MKLIYENGTFKTESVIDIVYIEGDGVGKEITSSMMSVVNAAVEKEYNGEKRIAFIEALAGEKALKEKGVYLPDETLSLIKEHKVAIKGPLTTPVGKGTRSINVMLRQTLDLYVCLRPVRYFEGVPSPVKHPENVDMVVFRENTEDIYSGIEWTAESTEAKKVINFLEKDMGVKKIRFPETSAVGIKCISQEGSKRLIRSALLYAKENNRKSVTLVHKGNIMKFTEGGFRNWGYECAKEEFNAYEKDSKLFIPNAGGDIEIKDCICDAFLQNILLKPEEYDVIATMNLNGDYVSDALAAEVGGIGIAPGANINYFDGNAIFEATHGTAPDIAGKNIVNPLSSILSASMMLNYIGLKGAAKRIENAVSKTIKEKKVTRDFYLIFEKENTKAECLTTREFTNLLIDNL